MGNNLLSAKATLPVYDRNNLAPRIVHLGFGAFHRAHQGVYADATRRYVIEPGRLRWMAARNCHSGCWILFAGIWRMTASSICWR